MSADPDQWPVADYMIINKEKVTVKCQHQIRFRTDRSVGDQVDALRHIDGGLSIKWLDPICIIVYIKAIFSSGEAFVYGCCFRSIAACIIQIQICYYISIL